MSHLLPWAWLGQSPRARWGHTRHTRWKWWTMDFWWLLSKSFQATQWKVKEAWVSGATLPHLATIRGDDDGWWFLGWLSMTQYDSVWLWQEGEAAEAQQAKVKQDFHGKACVNGLHERMESTSGSSARGQTSGWTTCQAQHGTAWHSMAAFLGQDETGCSQAAHSRKPICGPDHWVVHALEAEKSSTFDHRWS